jgi:hypothetical protein
MKRKILAMTALLLTVGASVARADAAPTNEELKRELDVLASEVQKLKPSGGSETEGAAPSLSDRSVYGYSPSASKVYRTDHSVSLGGYGEFIYDNFNSTTHAGAPASPPGKDDNRDRLTLARAVLYVGYKFDDHWVLNSEFEFENKGTDSPDGSVNAEFAYIDYLATRELNFRAGVLLIPMGLVNEFHEPTVFLGTHRPEVETLLIPTTWTEAGLGAFGELGPFTYRSYLVTGLNASKFTSTGGLEESGQGGANAIAESWASVTRFDYTGTPGFLGGISFYLGNSVTNAAPLQGGGVAIPTHIYEAHLEYKYRGLQLRALGAYTFLGRIAELAEANPALFPAGSPGTEQRGYYLEAGYDLLSGQKQAVIPFVRWEDLNTQYAVPTGFVRDPASYQRFLTAGVNYKPIEQLVLKGDFQDVITGDSSGVNRWSLAVGYIF